MDHIRLRCVGLLLWSCLSVAWSAETCTDAINNCADYGNTVCSSYREWAQQNCNSFCKFCTGGGSHTNNTSATGCMDVIENCAALGPNVCEAYVEFAHINCQKTCNLCTNTVPACADKLSNCAAYGQSACEGQYVQWARDNCSKFCNLCSNQGGNDGGHFSDVCYYKGQAYHEGAQWRDGCEKNCTCVDERKGYYLCQDMCPTFQNLPADCRLEKPTGECCNKPVCPPRTGCDYKGQVHQQGEQWQDGCTYLCTCKDGNTGYYECQTLCIQWNMLAVCHLADPAPGKCCPTPDCPANVHINYPTGYVPR